MTSTHKAPTGTRLGKALAPVVLVAAAVVCALVIFAGPMIAEFLITAAGLAESENAPLLDALFTIVLFGMLLVAAVVGARLCGVRPFALGRKPASSAALGLAIGFGGVAIAMLYARLSGGLAPGAGGFSAGLMLFGTLLIFFQAGAEEVYFRGWVQPVLTSAWGPAASIVVSALAFGFLHIIGGAGSMISVLNLFLGGLLFGLLAHLRAGIAAPVAGHFAWNWTEQMAFGILPNPGLGSYGAFTDYELAGAPLWGGSEEGLNASVAMTIVLAAFIVALLIVARARAATAVIAPARSAPDRSDPVRA